MKYTRKFIARMSNYWVAGACFGTSARIADSPILSELSSLFLALGIWFLINGVNASINYLSDNEKK